MPRVRSRTGRTVRGSNRSIEPNAPLRVCVSPRRHTAAGLVHAPPSDRNQDHRRSDVVRSGRFSPRTRARNRIRAQLGDILTICTFTLRCPGADAKVGSHSPCRPGRSAPASNSTERFSPIRRVVLAVLSGRARRNRGERAGTDLGRRRGCELAWMPAETGVSYIATSAKPYGGGDAVRPGGTT